MVSKKVIQEIDTTIEEIWLKNISNDYYNKLLLKEDSLKCCFYYHLRRKLSTLLKENNLRIYPEYYFSDLGFKADLAIVQIDPNSDAEHLEGWVTEVLAVIEFKYDGGNSARAVEWIKSDIPKLKTYVQSGVECRFYFGVIYETECDSLNWMDKRGTNNWAAGRVTELDAGYLDGKWNLKFIPTK